VLPISDVDAFAELIAALPNSALPSDWRQRVETVLTNSRVSRFFKRFTDLPGGTIESTIEHHFISCMAILSDALDVPLVPGSRISYGVGGLLAHPYYAYRGITDLAFLDSRGEYRFVTEFKTTVTFPTDHTWYHGSRGAQTFGAIYATNQRLPVFLLTQVQWKLFIESPDRQSILTIPSGYLIGDTNARAFVELLAICILAGYQGPQPVPGPYKEVMVRASESSKGFPPSATKPISKLKRRRDTPSETAPRRSSRFIVSDEGEELMYQNIWTLSAEEVSSLQVELGEVPDEEESVESDIAISE
jgi:hypothetical protein